MTKISVRLPRPTRAPEGMQSSPPPPPETTPPIAEKESAGASSGSFDPRSFVQSILDQPEAANDQEPEAADETASAAFIGKDEFFRSFRGMISAGNLAFNPPLLSLMIEEGNPDARAASDALYDICAEVHFLQFILGPSTKWAQRIAAIGMFGGGLYLSVRHELATRQTDRQEQRRPADGVADAVAEEHEVRPPPPPHKDMEVLNDAA